MNKYCLITLNASFNILTVCFILLLASYLFTIKFLSLNASILEIFFILLLIIFALVCLFLPNKYKRAKLILKILQTIILIPAAYVFICGFLAG